MIAPAGLNSAIEGRADPTPTLADLRRSGELSRPPTRLRSSCDPKFDQKQIKGHRDPARGETPRWSAGGNPLRFDGPRTCFADLTYRTPEGY